MIDYRLEFAELLSLRNKISLEGAQSLIRESESIFNGGWGGQDYRDFAVKYKIALKCLYGDGPDSSLIETYKAHSIIDFFRMLSYPIPSHIPILNLLPKDSVVIVDYGCGLAPRTLAMAQELMNKGISCKLYLVDFCRDLQISFLDYICQKYVIDYTFIEIDDENHYPAMPAHDYCELADVLEHTRDPIRIINNVDASLWKYGIIGVTLVPSISKELTHVYTDADSINSAFKDRGYIPISNLGGITYLGRHK